ncbi:MAG: type II toxin-antitoxin system RelE/ParE family toxin [Candidatus Thermoplasmatota archaeon]|nr:type II toxin-antitoxin system RelE/ParE family toxin [Candidatus Thermoplasmatota archaeon]
MTRRIVFRGQARAEFDAAADWYEKERSGLGGEFLNEIEQVLQRIAAQPGQFPKAHRDIRQAVARRFPYCVYFRERGPLIVVLAVFHSARNPALWRGRN